jgi:hypothetical protein
MLEQLLCHRILGLATVSERLNGQLFVPPPFIS